MIFSFKSFGITSQNGNKQSNTVSSDSNNTKILGSSNTKFARYFIDKLKQIEQVLYSKNN